ncbi:37S ribosomal protein S23 mitochondrial [Borealophlyctis nickersoniae]|nr:37S ribosomal protein S23 mitochondrial [Borealophlyctis nickersoniae]
MRLAVQGTLVKWSTRNGRSRAFSCTAVNGGGDANSVGDFSTVFFDKFLMNSLLEEEQPLSLRKQKYARILETKAREKAEDAAQPRNSPPTAERKSAGPALALGTWIPENANENRILEPLALPEDFLSSISKNYPKYLADAPSLMLRQTTLELIEAIKKQGDKKVSDSTLVLDGVRGTGKSATLMQVASHFRSSGWLVIYIPRLLEWVLGIEPYEKAQGELFNQPYLSAKVLESILKINGRALSKIKTKRGDSTLEELIKRGMTRPELAQPAVEELFIELSTEDESRPPLLIAIDQINGFYTKTEYRNVDSSVLTADRFTLVRSFLRFLTQEHQVKGAVVGALDFSTPQISSRFLEHVVSQSPSYPTSRQSAPRPLARKYQDLSVVDKYGVLQPKDVTPGSYDSVADKKDIYPKGIIRFEVPTFDRWETASILNFYKEAGLLFARDINRNYVDAQLLFTGGNGWRLFRATHGL